MLAVVAVMVTVLLVPATQAGAASPSSKMVSKINEYRQNRGLPGVKSSGSLNHSARAYAKRMMRSGYFGHSTRIRASRKFKTLGEIIEMHPGKRARVSTAFKAWVNSPAHNNVMLDGRFREVGAGKVTGRFRGRTYTFWVVHFGRK
jgi:uncharacterized protein YkwD